jgi:hypothetical protein
MLMMPHNPPEYAGYIEAAGYQKVKDLYAWIYDVGVPMNPIIEKLAARVRDRERITVRPLELGDFEREAERLRVIYCGAWTRTGSCRRPRRVPPAPRSYVPASIRVARCAPIDGRPVAGVAVPDINQVLKGTDGRLFPGLIRSPSQDDHRPGEAALPGCSPGIVGTDLSSSAAGPIASSPDALSPPRVLVGAEDNRDINQPAEQAGARLQDLPRLSESARVSRRVALTGATGFTDATCRRISLHRGHRGGATRVAAHGSRGRRSSVRRWPRRRCARPSEAQVPWFISPASSTRWIPASTRRSMSKERGQLLRQRSRWAPASFTCRAWPLRGQRPPPLHGPKTTRPIR